jgi:hypothetical protein
MLSNRLSYPYHLQSGASSGVLLYELTFSGSNARANTLYVYNQIFWCGTTD